MSFANELLKSLGRIVKDVLRVGTRSSSNRSSNRSTSGRTSPHSATKTGRSAPPSLNRKTYPGDYQGRPTITFDPHPGTIADPGEIAWTWVPYEEDHSQGKDRPVLIIGRDGDWLLALCLTSQDHDEDAVQEARDGRYWVDIGTGSWDNSRRYSEVRVNRIVRVNPHEIRRVADKLDKTRFDRVAAAVRAHS